MLLEFTTKNYKSFIEETKFSMMRAAKQSGLDYSIMEEIVNGKSIRGLCSSVVYGPNASGKTNIIGAMDVFKSIVRRGSIKNTDDKSTPNAASSALELIPNNKLKKPLPVEFTVKFTENNMIIKYYLSIDLGLFLDEDYNRKILKEELYINDDKIYNRSDKIEFGDLKVIKNFLSESIYKNPNNVFELAQTNLNAEELFLTNGFKVIFSQELTKIIADWFNKKFDVIFNFNSLTLVNKVPDLRENTIYIDKTINATAKMFGLHANNLVFMIENDNSNAVLHSIMEDTKSKMRTLIKADVFESYGTIRFTNIMPLIIRAIITGGTLVIDEFDSSIHPIAIMSIINIFHNDEINIHHAQLIFNTHNPIFLNSNIFRRDEIKFVERDDESHFSSLYSLSDFKTSGKSGVRKHDDYMKNYFINRYGAIKDIDFTPFFKKIIMEKGSETVE